MKPFSVDSSRPSRSRSSQYRVPQGPRGGGERTSAAYFKEVEDMFHDKPEKYEVFREVISDYQAEKIDTPGVIARVKELCKGYNHLLMGLNIFLPKGYEITVDGDDKLPAKRGEFEDAVIFVSKIKERFQNDEHVFQTFLEILNMYEKGDKDLDEVYNEVASLFEGHPDLISDYRQFF